MKPFAFHLLTLLLAVVAAFPAVSQAEQAMKFGKYIIHYNTVQTSFLTPKVARDYHITRSHYRGMLNISIQERTEKGFKSTAADVSARAVNLTGQIKDIGMRQVTDGDAIYYIGEFPVENEEVLNFTVRVILPGSGADVLRFREQFFTR